MEIHEYPKLMWVSDCIYFSVFYKRVVFMKKNNKYIAWDKAESIEDSLKYVGTTAWPFAKEIKPGQESIVYLTAEEISSGKGIGIDPHLIKMK